MNLKEICIIQLEYGKYLLESKLNSANTETKKANLLNRIINGREMQTRIKEIKFENNIPDEIRPLINNYGCFFDGYTFYYLENILDTLTDNDNLKTQAVVLELSNFYFGTYTVNGEEALKYLDGCGLLLLWHLGLIDGELKYSDQEKKRHNLYDTYPKMKNTSEVIRVIDSKESKEYLIEKSLFDDPEQKIGIIKDKIETANVIEYDILYQNARLTTNGFQLINKEYSQWWETYKRETHIYTDKENNILNLRNKLIQEHKNAVNMMKSLSI